jgi:hypothetical protein
MNPANTPEQMGRLRLLPAGKFVARTKDSNGTSIEYYAAVWQDIEINEENSSASCRCRFSGRLIRSPTGSRNILRRDAAAADLSPVWPQD